MIELKKVGFEYPNGVKALSNINLNVAKGEFLFIVGASGAGKSSLLKVLMRENKSTYGTVMVNGYNLTKIKNSQIPKFRRTIGVVFQDFRLIPSLNIFDNVAFGLRVIGVNKRDIKARVLSVLKSLKLDGKSDVFPNQLSGGEQQRVALARAIINKPEILIADEPTGNVDPELSYEIIDMLKKINKAGTTVLVITHEHDLINNFGGRTVTIENGKISDDSFVGGKNENK